MDWERDFYKKADQLYDALGTIEKLQADLEAMRRQRDYHLKELGHAIEDQSISREYRYGLVAALEILDSAPLVESEAAE